MSYARQLANATGRRWLVELDPRLKLAWIFGISLLSVVVDSTSALIGLAILGAAPAIGLRMSGRAWMLLGGLVFLTAWGTLLSQAMFYAGQPRTTLVTVLGIPLYAEGAAYGLTQSLRLIATLVSGLAVCLSTSPQRLLAALAWLRVPASLSFMTVTALRFLPTLVDEWAMVRQARALRGYRFRLLGSGIWYEFAVLVPLLSASLRRTSALAISVTCRGFQPGAHRTSYPPLRMRRGEKAILALFVAMVIAVTVTKWLYWTHASGWIERPELANLFYFAQQWL
jgi:energy-coupling factor transport system permease protein